MKIAVSLLFLLFVNVHAFAQLADPNWVVPTYIDTCEGTGKYRYIYPGQVTSDSAGNLVWLFRDRSTCRQPFNNFTVLKVTPAGLPLLATFRKYEYPNDWYYYNEQMTIHGNRAYWGGSSYARDTARSVFLGAFRLEVGDTLWTSNWYPVGKTTYAIVGMTAVDSALYITSNASYTVIDSPNYHYRYAMIIAKFDARTGKEVWSNVYSMPFSQSYKGNIVTDGEYVYACGSRYSDKTPLVLGSGFVGKYSAETGELLDSAYIPLKRRGSEYIPSFVGMRDSNIIVSGINGTQEDAALFTASISTELDIQSFDVVPTGQYASITASTLDTKGFLYMTHYSYGTGYYGYTMDVVDCRNGCHTVHRNVLLDAPITSVVSMLAEGNSLYLSTNGYDLDTTMTSLNRYNGYLVKYDVTPLALERNKAAHIGTAIIYPNPVTNSASVVSPVTLFDGELEIVDALGRIVKRYESLQGDSFTFTRGDLASGMYAYRLRERGEVRVHGKMMVE